MRNPGRWGFLEQNALTDGELSERLRRRQHFRSRSDVPRLSELIDDENRLSVLEKELECAEGDALARLTAEFTALNSRFIENGGLYFRSKCKSILTHLGFD